jgi:hypothetical protein
MKKSTKVIMGIVLALSLCIFAVVLVTATGDVAAAIEQETTLSPAAEMSATSVEAQYAEGVIDIVLGDTIAVSGDGATVDGTTVRITAAGIYHVSGALRDGQIDVDAKGKVYLEFEGVDLTNSSGPALVITDAKKMTLTLVAGTTNYLTDAACDSTDDAALFTNDTLVVNGSGTLVVTGKNNEGISSDDDIIINSGDVYIVAGGDGLDSNGTVNINGGTLVACGSTAGGDGGVDAIGAFTITSGTVVAAGNTLACPDNGSTQSSVYVGTGSIQEAGTVVHVERDGEEVLTVTPAKEFQNLLISSSDLIAEATYQVCVGDSAVALSVVAATSPAVAGSTSVSR